VGVLIAPLLGAALIPDLLEAWPQESRSLFFGLILGTIPIPWLRINNHQLKNVLVLVAAAVVSFILVGIPPLDVTEPGLWAVFGAALLAICAALLPGISGAFVLLILGMYTPIFDAINERNITVLVVFALGAGIGLGSFSVVLKSLLARAHDVTMAALVGLMLGSLRSLWPWLAEDRFLLQPSMGENFPVIVWLGLLGLLLSGGTTVWEMKKSKRGAQDRTI